MVIGIDPGEDTGIAFWEHGRLVNLQTVAPLMLFPVLAQHPGAVLVFEDSRLQGKIWCNPKMKVEMKLRYARSVGQIDGQCRDIAMWAKWHKATAYPVSPQQKGGKLKAAQFAQVTGWEMPSNQHERDAAMVAFMFRWTKVVA